MPITSIWMLGESQITVSGGRTLDGITQGDGSHLVGQTITLNSRSWQETFINDNDASFDDNDGNQTLAGNQVIDGVSYSGGTRVEAEYTLVLRDPTTGQTYTVVGYNVNNSSPAFGTIEGLAFIGPPAGWPPVGRALTVVSAREGPGSGGQPATTYGSYVTPPCFTPGTNIATPDGPRRVEKLVPGDLVLTLDHGPQPLRYVARTFLPPARLRAEPRVRPVLIPAHALGPGRPSRDLVVSPLHGMVLSGNLCELHLGHVEVICPARDLGFGRQLLPEEVPAGTTYLHLVFDRHEILWAEGALTESFRLGPTVISGAPNHARRDLAKIFPRLGKEGGTPWQESARPVLRRWEARLLAAARQPMESPSGVARMKQKPLGPRVSRPSEKCAA